MEDACNFTKSNTPPWVFFAFLSCTNGAKLRKASQMSFDAVHGRSPYFYLKHVCHSSKQIKTSIILHYLSTDKYWGRRVQHFSSQF